ncbi:clan AA aspartic protease [Sphingobacterium sp. N143]|uniref:aspartyl protease family protein n=1 Tax=Sphingobacterium sp. N143 TaxID=2746727 RepID=UPI002574DDE5|nr:aspartyl protease family protein [Sphingobacterium sp. N143]MDM1295388.1 clan AA aspartic protease [Sphingobacterium sp. N143]
MSKIKIKKLILLGTYTVNSIIATAQTIPAKLLTAFEKKDTSLLSDALAPNFSVAGHTGEGADFRLNQIINNYPLKAIHILSKKKTSKGELLQMEITDAKEKTSTSQALVDPQGKLVHFSLFDQLYGMKRKNKSTLRAVIPFENKNGSIYLQVKINGSEKPLRLLFDTGADGMAVSQQLADVIGLKVTRENSASVVGGHAKIQVSDNNTILLDTLKLGGQGIAIFPEMGRDGDGIIGNTLIRQFITHIDYDKNLLSLYDFGDFQYPGKGTPVPIMMPAGVMILPGQLEIVQNKSYPGHFVFDTGASYDLICFRPFVRQNRLLVSGFKPEAQAATVSMGVSSPTFSGKSYQFTIASLPAMKNLPVTLMGGSAANEQWKPGFDGSIGVRLLSRYNMTINLAEGEVYFSPNKLHALPSDFLIKNYQFGWDNTGQLKTLGRVGATETPEGIQSGILIQRIDNYTVDQLTKNPAFIEEIQAKAHANSISITLADNSTISI